MTKMMTVWLSEEILFPICAPDHKCLDAFASFVHSASILKWRNELCNRKITQQCPVFSWTAVCHFNISPTWFIFGEDSWASRRNGTRLLGSSVKASGWRGRIILDWPIRRVRTGVTAQAEGGRSEINGELYLLLICADFIHKVYSSQCLI